MNSQKFAALLRGINVGGNKKVAMEDLRKIILSLGFRNVATLLNSGNVVFEATQSADLEEKIEKVLEKECGYRIAVIIRDADEIMSLIEAEPFKDITMTKQTRLYVTFLKNKSKSGLVVPYVSPGKDFRIFRAIGNDVCSVITISTNKNTTDLMKILEKEFGSGVTTRNWNTVLRIGKVFSK